MTLAARDLRGTGTRFGTSLGAFGNNQSGFD